MEINLAVRAGKRQKALLTGHSTDNVSVSLEPVNDLPAYTIG